MTVKFTDTASATTGADPSPVATAVINGQTILYVGSGTNSDISTFRIEPNGSLTSLGAAAPGPLGVTSMTFATSSAGIRYLYAAGFSGDSIATFAINPTTGALSPVGSAAVFKPNAITTVTVGGQDFVFAGSDVNDQVHAFGISATGSLAVVGGPTNVNTSALASAVVAGTPYLFTAGRDAGRVTAYAVGAGGSLTLADFVADTESSALQLNGAIALAAAVLNGTTFVFAAGFADNGISAFRVDAGGVLTNVDNVTDSESAVLELDVVAGLTTGTIGGKTFLFAAGQGDDGVSVFAVSDAGILTNVGNIADDASRKLDGASGVATAAVNGETYLFATGMFDDGVSAFRLDDNSGNDTYIVDDLYDIVDETGGGGTDLVLTSINFNLSDPLRARGDVENLTLTGTGRLNGTGNHLANVITGNTGANVLNGMTGLDTLIGGRGNDSYLVDRTIDRVIEARGTAGGVLDKVTFTGVARQTYALATNVEHLTLGGAASSNGNGNPLNNVLVGNAGNNILNGMAGTDTLTGGRGNDTFKFTSKLHSGLGARADKILDFDDRGNDRIDLSAVFGPRMSFIGDDGFSKAGQVRINDVRGADIIVEVNTGGSLAADMHIRLVKTTLASMTASDFVL